MTLKDLAEERAENFAATFDLREEIKMLREEIEKLKADNQIIL